MASPSRVVSLIMSLLVGSVGGDGEEEEEVGVMVALVRVGVSGFKFVSLVVLWLSMRSIIRSSVIIGRRSSNTKLNSCNLEGGGKNNIAT